MNFAILIPASIFFALLLTIGFYLKNRERHNRSVDFSKEYFIGGRRLNGFVLAMSLVAGYSSVSSFVGGPGIAWQVGFAWVLFASVQIVAAYLILGLLGKKMAVIARKIDAITIIDLIRFRYNSNLLANLCALVILIFFITRMIAQFIGGAQIFAAVTGMNYTTGLLFFAVVVVVYTSIGGFNTVAITDTLCAIMMLIGMAFLTYTIFDRGHGLAAIMQTIHNVSGTAGNADMFSPTAGGKIPVPLLISQWILCGIGTVGLPQSAVRCISYKDTRSVHRAMIIGTIVCGAMMIGMPLLGVLAHGVITEPLSEIGKTTDAIIPMLIAGYMNPWLAGITIIGPLAATLSTISSLLITGSSAVVKDIYLFYAKDKDSAKSQKNISRISMTVTAVMGMIPVILAISPPDVIVWINLFAFGGLETAFFWILLFGFFWHKANSQGAVLSLVGGLAAYCVTMALGIKIASFHNIVIGIGTGLILFILGSLLTKEPTDKVKRIFFPELY
ncbi:sodium/pantothenate symporter [Pectinatus frisingensis]|jgi:sodium/pantothenate symporter|uniref:sodium/pantothenate symporter n=1 Tax=Pectinatus frisingensis TaxID=865 RepID=UPI0018C4731D|nr:sodium/pantothenate symporter [Pectinatus frisingensis]